MLTLAGQDVPIAVANRFDPNETLGAALLGLVESGLAFTDRRLFAWRSNGAGAPLPLRAIDRILIDTGVGSEHLDVVVLPRQAIHPALVLTRRVNELASTLAFVGELGGALGVEPMRESLGPIIRFSFPTARADWA